MTQSDAWGTVAKKDTLASHPELKRSADGELKRVERRFSRAEWAGLQPLSSREPVDPSIWGLLARRSRYAERNDSEEVNER